MTLGESEFAALVVPRSFQCPDDFAPPSPSWRLGRLLLWAWPPLLIFDFGDLPFKCRLFVGAAALQAPEDSSGRMPCGLFDLPLARPRAMHGRSARTDVFACTWGFLLFCRPMCSFDF